MTDTGLLILRLAIGATMLQAGLIKAFDFSTTVGFMESSGWRLPAFGAFMVTAAETLGGIGLLLGILTPLAACGDRRDGGRLGRQRVDGRVLGAAVQRSVPGGTRRRDAPVHRGRAPSLSTSVARALLPCRLGPQWACWWSASSSRW